MTLRFDLAGVNTDELVLGLQEDNGDDIIDDVVEIKREPYEDYEMIHIEEGSVEAASFSETSLPPVQIQVAFDSPPGHSKVGFHLFFGMFIFYSIIYSVVLHPQSSRASSEAYIPERMDEDVQTPDGRYQCFYCEKTFASKFNRKVHLRTHTGEKVSFISSRYHL